jgi:hypothetical protein
VVGIGVGWEDEAVYRNRFPGRCKAGNGLAAPARSVGILRELEHVITPRLLPPSASTISWKDHVSSVLLR